MTSQARRFSSISTIPVPDDNNNNSIFKIITLGNAGIGKSTLMASYARGTCEQDLSQQLPVNGKMVKRGQKLLQIALWDTAGQERYDSMTPNYYRGAHGCLLCFDITNEQSYADLITWHQKLINNCDPVPMTILVGLKGDLRHPNHSIQTIVSLSDCKLAARNLGLSYKEVSCYKQGTIENTFDSLISMIEENRRQRDLSAELNNPPNIVITETKDPEKKSFCKRLC